MRERPARTPTPRPPQPKLSPRAHDDAEREADELRRAAKRAADKAERLRAKAEELES